MSALAEDLPEWLNVSRETHAKLQEHLGIVAKWNSRINLVSGASLAEGWLRHVLDSAQLWGAAPTDSITWLDIGSGAGFPGLVIAIIAQELAPDLRVSLVESDRRKSVFLLQAVRELGLQVVVRAARLENLEAAGAAVISARALAPLDTLLQGAKRHLQPGGVALFPKGQNFSHELLAAQRRWQFDCDVLPSKTDPRAVILRIGNILDA